MEAGLFRHLGSHVSDLLYQRPAATDGNIVLLGIDEEAIDAYGQYQQWNRQKIADTIMLLNQSEDCRPLAIGIDVLHSTKGAAAEDDALVSAASRYGNVVTACVLGFDEELTFTGEGASYEEFAVTSFEEPFAELGKVTVSGHINAMLDRDGILRHHLLYATLPDGTVVPSMALSVAQMYAGDIELPETDERGFWYLPFTMEPGGFEAYSIADVLNGEIPPEYFDGKIVLIGAMAVGLQDSYFTAIDHTSQMYGVEYQANAIAALLSSNFKRETDDDGNDDG